jgi:hypothetical protein
MLASDGNLYRMSRPTCLPVCILDMFLAPGLIAKLDDIPKNISLPKIEYKPMTPSSENFTGRTMFAIPVDVLLEILWHVNEADPATLATLCRVNKIFCSCSQDILYRNIYMSDKSIIQTLAQSTDLARRVRSFCASGDYPRLATALRNMSSLRTLHLMHVSDWSILDGCTFKLDKTSCHSPDSKSFRQFLNSQPSLTDLSISEDHVAFPSFDERCLPNLTRVMAHSSLLRILIPGRPVREVTMLSSRIDSTDLSFFTLSTTPIQKLAISYDMLYPKPKSLLVSIFPSLVHLVVWAYNVEWTVRVPLCMSI